MTITSRLTKGSPLTHAELDANFADLATRRPAFITTVTADTTLDADDYSVLVDATADDTVITLPPAASALSGGIGRVYNIKKTDATDNTVTIDGNGAETIDGAATQVLTAQYQSVTIQSTGTSWVVL
jgi:hypothetical protein